MVKFVKVIAAADANYRDNKASGRPTRPRSKAVAKWSGAKAEDVPAGMALYGFPTPAGAGVAEVARRRRNGAAAKALDATAKFQLSKKQGRLTIRRAGLLASR